MLSEKIIRAWKDVEYRLSLSAAERGQFAEHPPSLVELTAEDLSQTVGGLLLLPPKPFTPPERIYPPEPFHPPEPI
jgi:mersacidin/lichenicidin family type 2 lantibiotic